MHGSARLLGGVLALGVALGACRTVDEDESVIDTDRTTWGYDPASADTNPVRDVEVVPRPEQTIATGRLAEVNNSGVTGAVTVRGIAGATEIVMNAVGLPEGTQQVEAALVRGPCEATGADVAPIGPLPVGVGNVAAVTDTLRMDPGQVLDGNHAIVVRGAPAGPGVPPLACAALPRWERLPPTG
jgi:hypothetical protein